METIIVLIILGILSSLFNKKEKPKSTKNMPPFSQQSQPKSPRQATAKPARTLEDFANEIFGQLEQKKAEIERQWQEPEPEPQPTAVPVAPEVIEKVEVKTDTKKHPKARPPLEESPRMVEMKKREGALFTAPTTRKALVQAIVAAEILGPPKAKQRQVR